jgi:hypothetical protein
MEELCILRCRVFHLVRGLGIARLARDPPKPGVTESLPHYTEDIESK